MGSCASEPSGTEPAFCLDEPADATCTESLYGTNPTFSDVFTRTLQPKCTACHSGADAQRGLAFDDEDSAYEALMGHGTTGALLVTPGDTTCGELIYRLEIGGLEGMPPGPSLSEQERCSIRHWIANGAPR
jgi:hypothetical protein